MDESAQIETNPQVEAIIANITQLMDEAEQMLRDSTSHHAEAQIELLRTRCEDLRTHFTRFCETAGRVITDGARKTDRAIRTHPYQSAAIALGIGTLLGVMVGRRIA